MRSKHRLPKWSVNLRTELSNVATTAVRRVERLRLTHARLTGLRESAQNREQELVVKVGNAKGRLALDEQVTAALEALQNRAHQRAVGAFERLLSAILMDVLPGKGEVKLELGTERGAPALDVQIDNCGAREDALEGSGGAVTNVLSAGLRYAALTRTSNRRLMVLDEPDCWLKPDRVPAFIRVLAQVAEKARTQTILISHHEPSAFEGSVNIVRLVRDAEGVVQTQLMEPHTNVSWLDDEEPGIRSIRLINFRAHLDTTLPLFPGVTALIGDNDLGKSTLAVSALRAVAYGEADDTVIRHGAAEARVHIELERGRRIEWVRRAKGSPRVMYALYENDELVHEGRPNGRGQVPEWITEVLGIVRVDDLDIQIGSQKSPVFLLNEKASTRARLLSVGRESSRLHVLIEAYADLKRKDREQVRDGEAEVARLRAQIAASERLPALGEELAALTELASEIETFTERQAQLAKFLARIDAIERRQAAAAARLEALRALPTPPALAETQQLSRLIGTIKQARRVATLRREFPAVTVPSLESTDRLAKLIGTIERTSKVAALRRDFPLPEVPTLTDNRPLVQLGQRLARLHKQAALLSRLAPLPAPVEVVDLRPMARQIERLTTSNAVQARLERDLAAATEAAEKARKELNELIEAVGGECPVCGGELKHVSEAVAHTHG